jgi:hypothetical protein
MANKFPYSLFTNSLFASWLSGVYGKPGVFSGKLLPCLLILPQLAVS